MQVNIFILFFSIASLFSTKDVSVQWLNDINYDFGDIPRHQTANHTFLFKNTSTVPIVIDNVRTSCGCTVPDWSNTPVLPDSTATINVEYDAKDVGSFYKKIKVFFHGRRKGYKLSIEGYVE